MTDIKICGLRRAQDVDVCVELGVQLLGFNLWPRSKRFVTAEQARVLVQRLPASVVPVGVFVEATPDEVTKAIQTAGFQAVQLHDDSDPSRYLGLGAQVISVVRVAGADSLPKGPPPEGVWRVLLDAKVEGYGGAGQSFDWSLVARAKAQLARPVLLAGGLTPENVGRAISVARPWAVDVASGVESAPGEKDPVRLRALVEEVRAADAGWNSR